MIKGNFHYMLPSKKLRALDLFISNFQKFNSNHLLVLFWVRSSIPPIQYSHAVPSVIVDGSGGGWLWVEADFLQERGKEKPVLKWKKHLLRRGSKRFILKRGVPIYFLVVFKFSFRYILSSSCWVMEDGPAAFPRPGLPSQPFREKSKYCWRVEETNVP